MRGASEVSKLGSSLDRRIGRRLLLALAVLIGYALLSSAAWPQEETAPEETASGETASGDTATEETEEAEVVLFSPIKVTARKIEELLRDIPFGVSVVGSERLEDERIYDVQELVRVMPNVSVSTLGDRRSTWFNIRGIGPMAQPLGYDDTSVVTYVDGVPQPLFASDMKFLDIERAEVLRGPQGTVFGRNAQAGAINMVTRLPSDVLEVEGLAELGEDWDRFVQASLSGPLIEDRLAGRLAASYSGIDGDVPNLANGEDVGDAESVEARGSLLFTPNARTEVVLRAFGEHDDNTPSNFVLKGTEDYPVVALDPQGDVKRNLANVSLTASHSFEAFTLTSVTAYNYYDYTSFTDNSEALTYSALFGLPPSTFLPATDFTNFEETQNSFYQELRLSSNEEAEISWVAGATYFRDSYQLDTYYQSAFFVSNNGTRDNSYRTNSYAAFGEATMPVPRLESLKVTLGLRYTHDTKHFDATYWGNGFPGTVASFHQEGTLDFDLVTGRAALSYDIDESSSVYATVARGAKSGGFPSFTNNAASGLPDAPYKESTSWTYEIGSKNSFLGGRALVNAALFFNDVKDENLFAFDSATFTFIPQPIDLRSFGAELEVGYRLLPGLDLFGSFGYTNAKVRNVSADVAASSGAADGNLVPNVPKFNSSLTLQYRDSAAWLGLPESDLLGMAQHEFVGTRAADVGNHFDLDAYNVVNAKLGLEFGHIDLYAFGQNLTDARPQYIGLYYGPGVEVTTLGHGRVVGVGAQFSF